jgi:hypothetical protein
VRILMDEERAYALALRVAGTGGNRVLEVRRAWSAAVAWQVAAEDCRTGERLLLLSESQFDDHLAEAGQPDAGEITIAQVTAHTNKRAATLLTS